MLEPALTATGSKRYLDRMGDVALISVDLDDTWAYLRTHGDASWESADSVLGVSTQRILDVFQVLDIKGTVFVVGRDAEIGEGRDAILAFASAGNEIANHSLLHRFDLATAAPDEIAHDISMSGEAIAELIGYRPSGFRCPSFGVSRDLQDALVSLGYGYDASLLPTYIGPALRWYHRRSQDVESMANVGGQGELFGPYRDGLLPLRPFRWEGSGILEVPVSTVPVSRTPMHMSYLNAAASLSGSLGAAYARIGIMASRFTRAPLSFLIHPPDVLDASDAPDLGYLPGMRIPWRKKVDMLTRTLSMIVRGRRSMSHADFVGSLTDVPLKTRKVRR